MSIEDILLQQVRQNVDRAKRTKETSMEYAPSPGQMSNFAGMMVPGAGLTDFFGGYPSSPDYNQPYTEAFSNEPYPSFAENLKRGGFGGYFDASMQGLGAAGDTILAAPVVGPPMGTFLKTMGAFGSVMRAGSKAGKGAKTEEGIVSLGNQPMFTIEDTINLAYTPDGSYSPGIKDLIEKASPKLRGQGITQWANKNLKPKELEVLGIDEFIKANPKATLKETVEGISGNKVVVSKNVYKEQAYGQSGLDFNVTTPDTDPLDGSVLWNSTKEDMLYDPGNYDVDLLESFNKMYPRNTQSNWMEAQEQISLGFGNLEDVSENAAKTIYKDNPYELVQPVQTGGADGLINAEGGSLPALDQTFAFGNEDVGYQLFINGQRKTPDDIAYSRTEAQIQLQNILERENLLDIVDIEGGARYRDAVDQSLPGGNNYREVVFNWENAPARHNVNDHFSDTNQIAHALLRDRKLADGTKTLHADEIQSDLHIEGSKNGYRTPENEKKINSELKDAQENFTKEFDKWVIDEIEPQLDTNQVSYYGIQEILEKYKNSKDISLADFIMLEKKLSDNGIVKGTDPTSRYRWELMETLSDEVGTKIYELEDLVPNYPYKKDYPEMVLKQMLLMAVEEGKPAISVSTSTPMVARYSDKYEEFYKILYDQDIPKAMRKLAKDYGGKFEKKGSLDLEDTLGDADMNVISDGMNLENPDDLYDILDSNVIKITEEMRNKILLEGVPDFAIGGIVNKGIATLKTAKQPTEGIVDLGLY